MNPGARDEALPARGQADPLVGGIEAGGTKFLCAVGTGPGPGMVARASFATGDEPHVVLAAVADWFRRQRAAHGPIAALGIASFGPVDLDVRSPTWGSITSTPKPGWANTDLVGRLRRDLGDVPVGFDTDVNGAALGERSWGAARGLDDFLYITMGTGIGAGGMARGRLLHGLVHPEMGHLRLPRAPGDAFPGACPFHGDCWEGLCSGPAIAARTGIPADRLPADHPAWRLVAHYTGLAIANIVCALSPRRVLLGGSVRKAGMLGEAAFLGRVRAEVRAALNEYIRSPLLGEPGIAGYIVPPELGDDAGLCGAIALAQSALAPAAP